MQSYLFFEYKHSVNGEHTYDNYLSDEPGDFILIEVICFFILVQLGKKIAFVINQSSMNNIFTHYIYVVSIDHYSL